MDTILSWNLPCRLQGILKKFKVIYNGWRRFNETKIIYDNGSKILFVPSDFDKNENFSINLGELKAEYNYTYEVSAVTTDDHENGFTGKKAVWVEEYPSGSKISNN